jgi:hypothetical protein
MTDLTPLERTLLKLVDAGKGKWGWYQIEIRLSMLNVERSPDSMTVLKGLAARGWLRRSVTEGSAQDRWEITTEGIALLSDVDRSDPEDS